MLTLLRNFTQNSTKTNLNVSKTSKIFSALLQILAAIFVKFCQISLKTYHILPTIQSKFSLILVTPVFVSDLWCTQQVADWRRGGKGGVNVPFITDKGD